jgi:hypothetical protein
VVFFNNFFFFFFFFFFYLLFFFPRTRTLTQIISPLPSYHTLYFLHYRPAGLTDADATRALVVGGVVPRVRFSDPNAMWLLEELRPATAGLAIPQGPFRIINETTKLAISPGGWGSRVMTGPYASTITVDIDVDHIEVLGYTVTGSRGSVVIPLFEGTVGVTLASGDASELAEGVPISDSAFATRATFAQLSALRASAADRVLDTPVRGAFEELVHEGGFRASRFRVSTDPCTRASAIALISAATTPASPPGGGAVILKTDNGFGPGTTMSNLANVTEAARGAVGSDPVTGAPLYATVCLDASPATCRSLVALDAVLTVRSQMIAVVTSLGETAISAAVGSDSDGEPVLFRRGIFDATDAALVRGTWFLIFFSVFVFDFLCVCVFDVKWAQKKKKKKKIYCAPIVHPPPFQTIS